MNTVFIVHIFSKNKNISKKLKNTTIDKTLTYASVRQMPGYN